MDGPAWELQFGEGPLVAAAIHHGSAMRSELAALLALGPAQRLYEEDPQTGLWTTIAPTRIVVLRSRFEMDLNRPREKAVYLEPEDAWGLRVWKSGLPEDAIRRSLAQYDLFYRHVELVLRSLLERHGRVVVFDLHSYNHRRRGPDAPPDDPLKNPEVNVGTATIQQRRWRPVVERLLAELAGYDFLGRRLDVRENVRFEGGWFSRWIHRTFPDSVCALAIEVKKFFMDEWTGRVDQAQFGAVHEALRAAARGVLEALDRL